MGVKERYQKQIRPDEHPNSERLVASIADFLKGMIPQEINARLACAIQLKTGDVSSAFFKLVTGAFENHGAWK